MTDPSEVRTGRWWRSRPAAAGIVGLAVLVAVGLTIAFTTSGSSDTRSYNGPLGSNPNRVGITAGSGSQGSSGNTSASGQGASAATGSSGSGGSVVGSNSGSTGTGSSGVGGSVGGSASIGGAGSPAGSAS